MNVLGSWSVGTNSFFLTLVNNISDGISTYMMLLIPISNKVEKRINSLRSNFLWEVLKGESFIW